MRKIFFVLLIVLAATLILQSCATMNSAGTIPEVKNKSLPDSLKPPEPVVKAETKMIKGEKPEINRKSEFFEDNSPKSETTFNDKKVELNFELSEGKYPVCKLTPRMSMAQVEEKIRAAGLTPYAHPEKILCQTKGKGNKDYQCWLPENTLVLYEKSLDGGIEILEPKTIGRCNNPVSMYKIKLTPAKETTVEKYRDKEIITITERFLDKEITNLERTKFIAPTCPPAKPCPSITFLPEERDKLANINWQGGGGDGGSGGCGGGSGASR